MKILRYALIALAIIIIPLSLYRSCQIDSAYKALRTIYGELKRTTDAERIELTATIAEKNGEIANLNKTIAAASASATKAQSQIKDKDKALGVLEAEYAQLATMPAQYEAQIENLEAQISIWSEKFTLAQSIIADKDSVIAAWEGKFNAQVTISESYKRQLDNETQLRKIQDGRVKYLEARVKSLSFMGTAKTIAIIGIGGYLTYSLLAKGK